MRRPVPLETAKNLGGLRKVLGLLRLCGSEQGVRAGVTTGQDGGAECAGVLRQGGNKDGARQGCFEGANHAGLQRDPAGKADWRRNRPPGQRGDAEGDGVLYPGGNVGGRNAFGQQPNDLGFGKDYAHAADEGGLTAITAQVSQGCQIDPQPDGDDFEEAATAGGTAVVHGKVPHATAVFEGDEFAVLATDLDDAADFWRQVVNTLRVASDLGNCGVRKPHGIAAVASGNDGADCGPAHFRVLAGAFEQVRRQPLLFHALIGEAGANDARLLGIEQHYFGRPRPCVYAGVDHKAKRISGGPSRFPAAPAGARPASGAWHQKLAALQDRLWESPGPLAPRHG